MNIAAQFVGREAKTSAKPFLKWAGGKTQLLNELSVYVPNKFNRYIEPFIGGGAMFFSLNAPAAVIGDSNPELVNVYQCLRDNADEVIEHLKKFKTTEKHFYEFT